MKISELCAEIGDENIKFQYLYDCLSGNIDIKKNYAKITFSTEKDKGNDAINHVLGKETQYTALVLWFPKEKFKQILDKEQKRENPK